MATIPVDLSGLTALTPIDAADLRVPILQLRNAVQQILGGEYGFESLGFTVSAETISAGNVLTTTTTVTDISNDSGSPLFDCVTINGPQGLVVLRNNNVGETTRFIPDVGNIITESGSLFTIEPGQVAIFWWNQSVGKYFTINSNPESLRVPAEASLTIASDQISPTTPTANLTPESGNNDSLSTIVNGLDLNILLLRPASASYTITLRHGTGNIFSAAAQDLVLTGTTATVMLVWNPVDEVWVILSTSQPPTLTVVDELAIDVDVQTLIVPARSAQSLSSTSSLRFNFIPSASWRRRVTAQANFNAGPTVVLSTTGTAWTATGTGPTDNSTSSRLFAGYTTGAVGTFAGLATGNLFTIKFNPRVQARFRVSSLTNRHFVGVYSGTISYSAGVLFTGVSGVFLDNNTISIYNAGVLVASQAVSGGALIVGDNYVDIFIDNDNSQVLASINGSDYTALSQSLAAIAAINGNGHCRLCAIAGASQVLGVSGVEVDSD